VNAINLMLDSRVEGDWAVVDVKGEIDLHTAPKLRERMTELVEQGQRRVILNMEALDFMDSTGLGVLIGSLKRLKENEGTLALVAPQHPIQRVLSVTGLTKVFPIHDTVEEAMAAG
jgi:anti-sigma B factor antagonist